MTSTSANERYASTAHHLPSSLVGRIIEVCTANGVDTPSENHVAYAALGSNRLQRALAAIGVDHAALKHHLGLLCRTPGGPFLKWSSSARGLEVSVGGDAGSLAGRAIVLSSAFEQHAVDSIDVFVAALWNPNTAVEKLLLHDGQNRLDVISALANHCGRYAGLTPPPARVVKVNEPKRVQTTDPHSLIQRVQERLGTSIYWGFKFEDDGVSFIFEEGAPLDGIID